MELLIVNPAFGKNLRQTYLPELYVARGTTFQVYLHIAKAITPEAVARLAITSLYRPLPTVDAVGTFPIRAPKTRYCANPMCKGFATSPQ